MFPSDDYCHPPEPVEAVGAFKRVLTDLLQHNLPNIASKLYTKSVISAAALAEATNQVQTTHDRTVSLLSVVEAKIRAEPHVFAKFVKILESEPSMRSLAKMLVGKGLYYIYLQMCHIEMYYIICRL